MYLTTQIINKKRKKMKVEFFKNKYNKQWHIETYENQIKNQQLLFLFLLSRFIFISRDLIL